MTKTVTNTASTGCMQTDTVRTRKHWIQHIITFAAETYTADTHTAGQRDGRRATRYLLRSLSVGEGNYCVVSQ